MNFLLHRHLAARDLAADGADAVDSEIAGIGAMLPDLWAMADRAVRPRSGIGWPPGLDTPTRSLLIGVEHHLRADAWFHRHPVFVEGDAALARAFRAAPITARKMGLFGHIGWELCLDGALVRRLGLDTVLDQLRQGLERTGPKALDAASGVHHPAFQDDPDARERFRVRVADLFASLLAGGWIEGYQHGHGLAARLSGVRRRIGLPPLSAADLDTLAAPLDAAVERADGGLDALFADPIDPST
ncbi:MAG: hypothetical protein AAGE94_11895 [Acidobacteriota bacterium]